MRIAIDATELAGRPTGVGRYLGNLLTEWLKTQSQHEFVLFCHDDLPQNVAEHPQVRLVRVPAPFGLQTLNQQLSLLRALNRERLDVFFAPAYTMPILYRGRTVLAVHDISFELHPEWFPTRHGARMRWLTRRSVRRAATVITGAACIADELRRAYDLDADSIAVINHGVDPGLREQPFTSAAALRSKLGFAGPFALMVGTLFERRFPIPVIDAFRHLGDLDLRLVIVGADRRRAGGNLEQDIATRGLADRVTWLDYASDEDLLGLYREASQLTYLSEYEGFGLPPLEAMLFEKPVIVSARGALEEIYRDSALMVENETAESIATAIRSLVVDRDFTAQYVARGRTLAARLTVADCAARTLEVLLREVTDGAA